MSKKKGIDFSGLDNFNTNPMPLGNEAPAENTGRPLQVRLKDIIEDPDQPRKSFDEEALKELASSIELFGVLMPISVRPNPAGGYIINSGARRFKASVMAKRDEIPCYVMESGKDSLRYEQMAENIHRESLTPLEIASFISAEVAAGSKQTEVAKKLGKSKTFVSRHLKIADAPDWIKGLSSRGVCSDATTLAELISFADSGKIKIEDLESVVSGMESISRSDVQNLINPPAPAVQVYDPEPEELTGAEEITELAPYEGEEKTEKPKKEKEPNLDVAVYIGGRKGYLQTKQVQIYFDDSGTFENVPIKDLPPLED